MADSKVNRAFRRFSAKTSRAAGSPTAFLMALLLVLGWLASGFYFKWSDPHSFFINNTTTIITFLMTFVIQSSQNRDSLAIQLKLNELIRATTDARNTAIALEDCDATETEDLRQEFKRLRDEE